MSASKFSAETRAKIAATVKRHYVEHPEARTARMGAKNPCWRGGRKKAGSGYVTVLSPSHPLADKRGYVPEHRLVMERHIGRTLLRSEVVHHINGINDDNRIENLMLFSNNGQHTAHHNAIKRSIGVSVESGEEGKP